MEYKYEEKSLLGGWQIEVRKNLIHVGNIRRNPSTGGYQFFKGPYNQLNPSFEEQDLEDLKQIIESSIV